MGMFSLYFDKKASKHNIRDNLFSTFANFSEKRACAYQGVRSVSFPENIA